MGYFSMTKGVPSKRYTPEFKNPVAETMLTIYVNSRDQIESWKRIYLTDG